jgi:hypothetical protein
VFYQQYQKTITKIKMLAILKLRETIKINGISNKPMIIIKIE